MDRFSWLTECRSELSDFFVVSAPLDEYHPASLASSASFPLQNKNQGTNSKMNRQRIERATQDQTLRSISQSTNRNRILSGRALISLLALIAFAAGQTNSSAAPAFYALIVNGSPNLLVSYDGNYLLVRGFRRTLRAAGAPSGYVRNVPPGAAAWPDRPLNAQEPLTLKQKMTPEQAKPAIERLRQNGGYWKFYCRNTGAGYFEVSRSEPAYASVRID